MASGKLPLSSLENITLRAPSARHAQTHTDAQKLQPTQPADAGRDASAQQVDKQPAAERVRAERGARARTVVTHSSSSAVALPISSGIVPLSWLFARLSRVS